MNNYLKLAWRNIWRNKRRTLLTTLSIALAVFIAILVRSLQIGVFGNIIDNIVKSYVGNFQIHKKGYWEKKEDINNTFEYSDTIMNTVCNNKNVAGCVPRLESFALASNGDFTKGVMLVGIVPVKEDSMTKISKKLTEGQFLCGNDDGVLVAQGLAAYLKLKTNDTLVLIGQGYQGASAAGKYPVRGIIHFPSPDIDGRMVYMNLPCCQAFFSCPGRLTSISVNVFNENKLDKTIAETKAKIDNEKYEVMRWDEMIIELQQTIKSKTVGSFILLGIIYIIVAFGIFGTVLMMTSERIKEFGVFISVGLQKTRLSLIVAIEMIYIGILGIITGLSAATPILLYFNFHPIRLSGSMAKTMTDYGIEPVMKIALSPDIYIAHSIIVMVLVVFSIIYPVRNVMKLNIVKALHSK